MQLSQTTQSLIPEIIRFRRDLHRIPETAFEEFATADYLETALLRTRPDALRRVGKTGLIAEYRAACSQGRLAFRADIDALNVKEETGLPFASSSPNMHACGHDGHMSMLLGLACAIAQRRSELAKDAVLIFQPGEENAGGAQSMIEAGCLDGAEAIFGIHLWPEVPAARFGIKPGGLMARMFDMDIEITGRASHAAYPQRGADALVAAAHFITQAQTVVSRSEDPFETVVFTLGRAEGGTMRNVLCENVRLEGTLRCFSQAAEDIAVRRLRELLAGISAGFSCTCALRQVAAYPAVMNDETLASRAAALVGEDAYTPASVMPSEDFAYYQQRIPGLYTFLGTGDAAHSAPLHSGHFDFDEGILALGVEYYQRILFGGI